MSGLAIQPHTGDTPRSWTVDECVTDIAWSPDSSRFVVADAAGKLTLIDIHTGEVVWSMMAHAPGVSQLDWRQDGKVIATAGQEGLVKLWDPDTGTVLDTLPVNGVWVDSITWSPAGDMLAASAGKTVIIWDQAGSELLRYDDHLSTVTAIAWNPDSRELASACYRGIIFLRIGSSRPYQTLHCLGSLISLAWSPDGKAICAGSQDRMLQFWRLPYKKGGHAEMKGYPEKVSSIDWSSGGQYIASAGSNTVVVWKNKGKGPAGTTPTVLKGHQARITQLQYQHKGSLLASAAQDGSIIIWQLKQGNAPVDHWNMDSETTRLAWSPDDQVLVAGNKVGEINLFTMPLREQ